MTKGLVSQHVEERVKRGLAEKLVLVWYDPARAFEGLLDELELPANTTLLRYDGSCYRLRADAEQAFSSINRGGSGSSPYLLLYVSAERPAAELNVLRGLESAGGILNEDLATLAREALREVFAQAHLDEVLSNAAITLEDLDRLAGGTDSGAGGVLSVIFGPVGSHEIIARYLAEPDLEPIVAEKNALPALRALAKRTYGAATEGGKDQADFKHRLWRHLLLTEFRTDLVAGTEVPSLAGIVEPGDSETQACRQTVQYIRKQVDMRDLYAQMACEAQADYRLDSFNIPAERLGGIDTFPFEETQFLDSLDQLIRDGKLEEAERLTERRSFWVELDPRRGVQWQVARNAIQLYSAATRMITELKSGRRSLEELVRSYAEPTSGWHLVDRWQRLLEHQIVTMEDEFRLEGLLQLAEKAYQQAVETMEERFTAALVDGGFRFGGLELQTSAFQRHVEPFLNKEPIAYFLVDALRYEMGAQLAERFTGAEALELHAAIGTPPTITPVGMAALLPGAQDGLGLVEASGKFTVQVGSLTCAGPADRVKAFQAATGNTTLDITLDDLLTKFKKIAKLKDAVAGKRLILVRSLEIDAQGEQDNRVQATRTMTYVLDDLRTAVSHLAEAGVRRFVIAADHGHLFGEQLDESMKIDPPGGNTMVLHRRCWIGRGGVQGNGFLRFTAAQLGLGGDLEFAFPKGLGAFKTRGGTSGYFHGGLSPQELVIPVLSFRIAAPQVAEDDQFDIKCAFTAIRNRFFTVKLQFVKGTLMSPDTRRVRCILVSENRPIGRAATALYGYDLATEEVSLTTDQENVVTMICEGQELEGSAFVRVLDPQTGAVLAETRPFPFEFTS